MAPFVPRPAKISSKPKRRMPYLRFTAAALVVGGGLYVYSVPGISRLAKATIVELGNPDARQLLYDVLCTTEGHQFLRDLGSQDSRKGAARKFIDSLTKSKNREIVAAVLRAILTKEGKEFIAAAVNYVDKEKNKDAGIEEILRPIKPNATSAMINDILTSDNEETQKVFNSLSALSNDSEITKIISDFKTKWLAIKGKKMPEIVAELKKPDTADLFARAWQKSQTGAGLEFIINARKFLNKDGNLDKALAAIGDIKSLQFSPEASELNAELRARGDSLEARIRFAIRIALQEFAAPTPEYTKAANPADLMIAFFKRYPEILDFSILKKDPHQIDAATLAQLNQLGLGHKVHLIDALTKSGVFSPEGLSEKIGNDTYRIQLARGHIFFAGGNGMRCGHYVTKGIWNKRVDADKGLSVSITKVSADGQTTEYPACVVGISDKQLYNIQGLTDPKFMDAVYLYATAKVLAKKLHAIVDILPIPVAEYIRDTMIAQAPKLKQAVIEGLAAPEEPIDRAPMQQPASAPLPR